MVNWEQDNLDAEFDMTEIFTHQQNVAVTVYTGATYVGDLTFHKVAKKYFMTTKSGKELCFRKSAVLCIEDI